MIFFNVLQPCGSAAQQFINHTVQNHQQDWNDVREGTIMLITLPEDNTGKTVLTVHSLKEGRGWGGVCRAATIPGLKRAGRKLTTELLNLV